MKSTQSIPAVLFKGAIAGLAATWAMGQVTSALYEAEGPDAQQRESDARGGRTAYESAANKLARAAGVELSEQQQSQGGSLIHWITGTTAGAKYALLRQHWRPATAGYGAAYGLAFFLVIDEMLNPALGLTPGPASFPWQTHARGAVGHVTFGYVNESVLWLLDQATDRRDTRGFIG
jgi:hypothetical protein